MDVTQGISAAAITLIFLVTVVWYTKRSRYRRLGSMIPGPRGLPLLGVLLEGIARREDIMDYAKELRARYGAVCKAWVGTHLVVGITDPVHVAAILNSSGTLKKPVMYKPISLVYGNSLLTAGDEEWRKLRRIMNRTFAHQVIESYVGTFCEKSRLMADQLGRHSDGRAFSAVDHTLPCALEMLSETSLGVPTDVQGHNKQHRVTANFPNIFSILAYMISTPWYWFTFTLKCSVLHKEIYELANPIRRFVDCIIQEKINYNSRIMKSTSEVNKEDANTTCTSEQRLGFLDHMITTMVSNPGLFTAEDLKDQTMLVIGAGTETTSYTVATTLMLLGIHQDVQRKVVEEQEFIFGEDIDRPVTARDLSNMVYLEQVINETLRLYPVIPLVGRWIDEDVVLSSYTIPAGSTVVIPIYLVHRETDYYPNPNSFDPERFNKENSIGRPSCSFIPFASGPKMCLGRKYTYMAVKTMLSVVLRRYQVLEYGSQGDMECFKFEFILKLVNGYNIKIRPRKWDGM